MQLSRGQFRTQLHAAARRLAHERPDLATRIWRAVALVEAGAVVEPAGRPDVIVRSQAGRGTYTVSPNLGCTCPDATEGRAPSFGRVPGCKHYLAAWLQVRAAITHYGLISPGRVIPFPRPTLDPDAPIPYELTARARGALDGEGPAAA